MKITLNRTISFLLALAMVVAMLPAFGTLKAHAASLVGSFDSISCPEPGKIRVRGWAADQGDHSAVTIHVYVGGGAGAPDAEDHDLGKADGVRTDVNTVAGIAGNHGFDFTFDTQKYGDQTVYVYAIIGTSNAQIGDPKKACHAAPRYICLYHE